MKIEKLNENGTDIALVSGGGLIVTDAQSALDMAVSAEYETGAKRIVLDKKSIDEKFFILSSGMAGEVLQKLINYHFKVAIYGDYSRYTSKPLHDFIYESNNGKDVFFVGSKEEAVRRLARAE